MPIQENAKLHLTEIANMPESDMLRLSDGFSYLSLIPMPDEDLKPYIHEPLASLPPAIKALLPPTRLVLVPYLEWDAGHHICQISFQQPAPRDYVRITQNVDKNRMLILLSMRSEPVPDYHDTLFRAITRMALPKISKTVAEAYAHMILAELNAGIHGEVGEASWDCKQELHGARKGKKFDRYYLASLEDTLSLYLHGICCDIDVEKGPRQIASKYLRMRLNRLYEYFAPPEGYAVFPEQLRAK